MNILRKIIVFVVALVAILAVIGLLLPRTYKMERSVLIQAPVEIPFDQVNDLKKNENWSPWKAADPTVAITYGSTTAGVGAAYSWTSKKSGEGTMTITASNPYQDIQTDLDFKGMGKSIGYFTFTPEATPNGQAVRVLQGMRGDLGYNIPGRYMNLMMEKMVGPYFEKGLAKIKEISEAEAARQRTEQQATRQALATPVEETAAPAKAGK